MIEKYRVSDVAKDLNVDGKDVIELLSKTFPTPKKLTTALSEQELNVVFEHYTAQHEVGNFAAYFAMANEPKSEKKAEAKEKNEVKESVKAQNAPKIDSKGKPASVEKNEAKPAPKAENKPAPKAENKPTPKAENKPAPKAENKPAPKAENKPAPKAPQNTVANESANKPVNKDAPRQNNNQDRFSNKNGQGNFGERRNNQNNFGERGQNNGERKNNFAPRQNGQGSYGERNQGGFGSRQNNQQGSFGDHRNNQGGFQNKDNESAQPRQKKQPVERKARPANMPPTEKLGAGVAHVDMRAANVDLDKYNEKYEQIAPASDNKDNYLKKQKLNQRSAQKGKPQKSRHEQELFKMKKLEMERARRQKLEIVIPDEITVSELALRLKVQASEIIKRLMMQGVMATVNEVIDFDTAALVAMDIGAKVEKEVVVTIEDRLIDDTEDEDENLLPRNPIVVVMGHVDHGKTSILDYIRKTHVTSTEAGGITQHIGAYRVTTDDGRNITFLDTPGHEAFTAMRARGALCTDIAILVVAADDGIMPQTVEAINHAKAAGVSIIVAINKMDKPEANPDKVMQGLTEYELIPEEWGGDVICVPVSAKTGMGIDNLLEMVNLVADVKELKANPDRLAKGTVIEARLDKGRGPIATVLVQNGTLHTGDVVIAGTAVGKVRVMTNDKGQKVDEAGPCVPVEITGLDSVPTGGDIVNAVTDERLARELVEQREYDAKQEQFKNYQKVTLDNLFSQIEEGEMKELPIIVKADVQGSVEAVRQSLEKISNEEVRVRVIHGGVGAVNESDVMLANASNAIIVGFNVRPDPVARDNAERDGVEIRLYRIIYDAIEEITSAMKGMLAPKYRDIDLGRAEVRNVFKISSVGTVAGGYVLEGKISRAAKIRVVRDGIIIADDKLDSLKRFKDDVKEVNSGYECGMSLEKFSDIKEGDIFEAYITEEYREG